MEHHFAATVGRAPRAEDIVALSLDKGVDLYVAILATLWVGASYVPLDPTLAADLQAHILDTSGAAFEVTTRPSSAAAADRCMDPRDAEAWAPSPAAAPRAPEDGCYTIFTSGSTGRPKGVRITDRNLLNLVDWMQAEFALAPGRHVLQYSTINFDASILDIFPTLLSGAALCVPTEDQRLSAALLEEFCTRHQVDLAFLPPALLGVLDAARFPALRDVLTGGEACSPATLADWGAGRRLYNLYGPTECTVLVSFKPMAASIDRTNIGQAIPGVRLHVLDDDGRPAARGELHVAGAAVSSGYVGNEAATRARFVAFPAVDDGLLYKTGDIVDRDTHGDLHFVGRTDRQVKVRGYRIELEEIEDALVRLGCPQAAVKQSYGELVAHVVLPTGQDDVELRRRLAETVGEFKVPSIFRVFERLPVKPSGKVDYDALPELAPSELLTAPTSPEPTSDALVQLAALWGDVLGVPAHTLDVESNFRHLGGTSIKIVRLLGAIDRRFAVRVPFADFLQNPTLGFLFTALQTP
jgi:amino acid adenylation domain-containing protein